MPSAIAGHFYIQGNGMSDPVGGGWQEAIVAGVATVTTLLFAVSKWFDFKKNETTQVTILKEQNMFLQARADKAEASRSEAWDKLNRLIIEQSEMKAQNATLLEQVRQLREDNDEMRAQLNELLRCNSGRANA